MVAALGLNLLVGEAGQLSLAHSFFVAVGAYGYTFFASPSQAGPGAQAGWDLPPTLAVVLAVGTAGGAGLLFSPIAARLRGIYLGVASLGLVTSTGGGVTAGVAARFCYGAAVVALLLVEPGGLAALGRRARRPRAHT